MRRPWRLAPPVNGSTLLLLLPLLVLEVIYMGVVQGSNEFDLARPTVWVHLAQRLAVDFALYLGGTMVLLFWLRSKVAAGLFSSLYLLVLGLDTAVYFHGATLLERHHLLLARGNSILPFLTSGVVVYALVVAATIAFSWALLLGWAPRFRASVASIYWGVVFLALLIANPARWTHEGAGLVRGYFIASDVEDSLDTKQEFYESNALRHQLGYATTNPLVNLFDQMVLQNGDGASEVALGAPEPDSPSEVGMPFGKTSARLPRP